MVQMFLSEYVGMKASGLQEVVEAEGAWLPESAHNVKPALISRNDYWYNTIALLRRQSCSLNNVPKSVLKEGAVKPAAEFFCCNKMLRTWFCHEKLLVN